MAAPALMRSQDYFRTPLRVLPAELIYGAMRLADSPLPRHQAAVAQLFRALDAHVRERKLGDMWLAPLDVILDYEKALIVQPDLFFVSNFRKDIIGERVRGAPDLVIEVLSPNPRIGSVDERVRWFAEYLVRECWLLHQDRRELAVLQFANRRVRSRRVYRRKEPIVSAVLPDFTSCVDDILI